MLHECRGEEEVPITDFNALLLKSHVRIDEAAILLDVTPRTVHQYLETGKLTPVIDPWTQAGADRGSAEVLVKISWQ